MFLEDFEWVFWWLKKKVYFMSLFYKISKNEWFNKFYKNEGKTQYNYVYNVILTKTNITIRLRAHQCFRWWKIEKSVSNEGWSVLICKSVQSVTYVMYYIDIIKKWKRTKSFKFWEELFSKILSSTNSFDIDKMYNIKKSDQYFSVFDSWI